MARRCERPGCGRPASVAYGFDPERRLVWLDTLTEERFRAGSLCKVHADALRVPREWWLDDRRTPESLFEVEAVAEVPVEDAPPAKPKRRRKAAPVVEEPAGAAEPVAAEEAIAEAPAAEVPVEPAVVDAPVVEDAPVDAAEPAAEAAEAGVDGDGGRPAWEPAFASVDPDPAVDVESTPLLARAFGRDAPLPGHPRRKPRRSTQRSEASGSTDPAVSTDPPEATGPTGPTVVDAAPAPADEPPDPAVGETRRP